MRGLVNSSDAPATVGTRARIVLWRAEGKQKTDIAAWVGMSRPTVDLWLARYASDGPASLLDRRREAGREQVPASIRARVLALSRTSPPSESGSVALVVAGDGRVPHPHRGNASPDEVSFSATTTQSGLRRRPADPAARNRTRRVPPGPDSRRRCDATVQSRRRGCRGARPMSSPSVSVQLADVRQRHNRIVPVMIITMRGRSTRACRTRVVGRAWFRRA